MPRASNLIRRTNFENAHHVNLPRREKGNLAIQIRNRNKHLRNITWLKEREKKQARQIIKEMITQTPNLARQLSNDPKLKTLIHNIDLDPTSLAVFAQLNQNVSSTAPVGVSIPAPEMGIPSLPEVNAPRIFGQLSDFMDSIFIDRNDTNALAISEQNLQRSQLAERNAPLGIPLFSQSDDSFSIQGEAGFPGFIDSLVSRARGFLGAPQHPSPIPEGTPIPTELSSLSSGAIEELGRLSFSSTDSNLSVDLDTGNVFEHSDDFVLRQTIGTRKGHGVTSGVTHFIKDNRTGLFTRISADEFNAKASRAKHIEINNQMTGESSIITPKVSEVAPTTLPPRRPSEIAIRPERREMPSNVQAAFERLTSGIDV